MYGTKYDKSKIIQYIDKYYKLFNYDKSYKSTRFVSMLLYKMDSSNYFIDGSIYLLNKINFIKEITKTNDYKENLLSHVIRNTYDYHNYINLTGILCRPFDENVYYSHNIFIYLYIYSNSNSIIYKNTKIIVNYFGILNKPSCRMTHYNKFVKLLSKTNIWNKLILVYGKY